jgi:hypothetical protein
MTPAQIETAARELCRIRGIDPDATVQNAYLVYLSPHPKLEWHAAAREVERFIQVGTAIAAVAELPKPRRKKRLDSAVGEV